MKLKVSLSFFVTVFTLIWFYYQGFVFSGGKSKYTNDFSSTNSVEKAKLQLMDNGPKRQEIVPKLSASSSPPLTTSKQDEKCSLSPSEKFSTVKYFVLFIGYSRSGSTLVGSLLDAHPHAIIANEYFIVNKFAKFSKNQASKEYIFNQLFNSSVYEATHFQRAPQKNGLFTYNVPNQWQGNYDCSIKIIGDKKGAGNSHTLSRQENIINELRTVVKVPIKFIHVYRNPYDNIATMTLRQSGQRLAASRKNFTALRNIQLLKRKIKKYLSLVSATENLRRIYSHDVFDVNYSELMKRPRSVLSKLCEFLHLHCSQTYLSACSKKLFRKETFTRDKVQWTEEIKANIASKVKALAAYREFTFEHE
eukprot:gene9777-10776_t